MSFLKKHMKYYLKLLILSIIFCSFLSISLFFNTNIIKAYNNVPYETYVYNFWGEPVPTPTPYVPSRVIDGNYLGIDIFDTPMDMFVENNNIYILDTGNNRIIYLNEKEEVEYIIDSFIKNGQTERFERPEGIFVTQQGHIYVADTGNNRVVELNDQGKYIREIGPPFTGAAAEILEETVFSPENLVVGIGGRIYVLAKYVNEGFMVFDADGYFEAFIGAPEVRPSPADLFWRQIATEEQRRRQAFFVPTEFSGIGITYNGFIQAIEGNEIRLLNPGGLNVIKQQGNYLPPGSAYYWGDVNYPTGDLETIPGPSSFIDVVGRKHGIYSVLDERRGRIFTYSPEGELLYIFGGLGDINGTFRKPVAMGVKEKEIFVLDERKEKVYVFAATPYVNFIYSGLINYYEGRYNESTESWQKVLTYNENYAPAISGIGRAKMRQNDYKGALTLLRRANDRSNYSKAFNYYRQNLIEDKLSIILTALLMLMIIALLYRKLNLNIRKKYKNAAVAIMDNTDSFALKADQGLTIKLFKIIKSIRYSLYAIFHPVGGFWDLKHDSRGNLPAAFVILFFTVISYLFLVQYTGFLFNYRDISQLNIYLEMLTILIPFFLWCIVNWAVTTLMEGKGSFKEIFIATAFAFTPLIITYFPAVIFSNYITLEEGNFFHFALSLGLIWSLCLIFFGNLVIHDYSFAKMLLTSIITILGISVIIFISLLFFNLFDLIMRFIVLIYSDLMFL